MPVQTTYVERQPQGFPGQVADMTTWNADTRNVEGADGIGFGLAVGQGTADKGAVLGGALALFVGVSIRSNKVVNSVDPSKWPQYSEIEVFTMGDIYVSPSVAVLVTDPVHYDATTGRFAISGGSGPIVGARWMQGSAADGIAILRLSGALPVP